MADQSHNGQPRQPDPAEQDEPATTGKPAEFDRFEDLARKLVKVPKKELDEKLKQGKR